MSDVVITKTTDEVFGNIVRITNGIVELEASLDFGPRILRYNIFGKENMLFNDHEKKPLIDEAFDEFDGGKCILYGGHRLWVSPEVLPRCYYPDNHPVTLTETVNGVILEAPIEKINNIQKSIEIKLNEYNAEVEIKNTVKNVGLWDIVFAPWSITIMAEGGVQVIPQADRQTGLLSNRFVGLWPYAKMTDPRVYWGDNFIVLRQDPSCDDKFKIGTNNESGWSSYFNRGQLFVKSYHHVPNGIYPDFAGCSFETYTDKRTLEIEVLGQMSVVEPGASLSLTEKWTLFEEDFKPGNDEQKIIDTLKKYI